tara:strand:- start:2633 stop:3913 length:1281 start_codon:yes stop_codon:yes gene_type:complete
MTESNFGSPTQFEITEIKIDNQDITGLFFSISIFENLYSPVITGNIIITDSDGAGFIEENGIEFIESIEFSFKNANGDTLKFKGVLNGLRNEIIQNSLRFYTIDFSSEAVRKNEQTYLTNAFRDTKPRDIVSQMAEKLGGEIDSKSQGIPMTYISSRRRPIDVIRYVLTHGLSDKTEASEQEGNKSEEAKGTTGFMFWETLDGFRFETVDNILAGEVGSEHKDYNLQLVNNELDMKELMKSIIECNFKQIGDFQTKLRSGAFGATNISFDMDSGEYKEYKYYNEQNMTDKQKKALPIQDAVTRYFSKPISNQKFMAPQQCTPSQPFTGDQSRKYLNQNAGRQNTFSDQSGEFTLYPQFDFRAGDPFECKVSKVKDEESEGGYDKKHSGRYIIQQVGHHFFTDGRAYTKIKTIRSTIQQDDSSSTKS